MKFLIVAPLLFGYAFSSSETRDIERRFCAKDYLHQLYGGEETGKVQTANTYLRKLYKKQEIEELKQKIVEHEKESNTWIQMDYDIYMEKENEIEKVKQMIQAQEDERNAVEHILMQKENELEILKTKITEQVQERNRLNAEKSKIRNENKKLQKREKKIKRKLYGNLEFPKERDAISGNQFDILNKTLKKREKKEQKKLYENLEKFPEERDAISGNLFEILNEENLYGDQYSEEYLSDGEENEEITLEEYHDCETYEIDENTEWQDALDEEEFHTQLIDNNIDIWMKKEREIEEFKQQIEERNQLIDYNRYTLEEKTRELEQWKEEIAKQVEEKTEWNRESKYIDILMKKENELEELAQEEDLTTREKRNRLIQKEIYEDVENLAEKELATFYSIEIEQLRKKIHEKAVLKMRSLSQYDWIDNLGETEDAYGLKQLFGHEDDDHFYDNSAADSASINNVGKDNENSETDDESHDWSWIDSNESTDDGYSENNY